MVEDENQSKQEWVLEALDSYEGRLIQYASRLIGNLDQARDVVQETFLQLWKENREKIDNYLEQWLYTVCRNRALDLLKKEKRMFSLNTETDFADTEDHSPNAAIEKQEIKGSVNEAIQALPPNQREVVRLKFQDELSYKEISKITGLSVTNVGFLIHSGIKSMRSSLKKKDNFLSREGV